eukprot:scaffold638_cov382-Prasinococcus_capsulatus_cf.AAC.12
MAKLETLVLCIAVPVQVPSIAGWKYCRPSHQSKLSHAHPIRCFSCSLEMGSKDGAHRWAAWVFPQHTPSHLAQGLHESWPEQQQLHSRYVLAGPNI